MPRSLITVFACIFLTTLAATAPAQPLGYTDHQTPPDLPGVDQIEPLIDVFNSGDADKIEAFLTAQFAGPFVTDVPMEEHVHVWQSISGQWGQIKFTSVRTYDEPGDNLVVILHSEMLDEYKAFVLSVNDDGNITMLQPSDARPPSFLAPAEQISLDEAVVQLDGLITKWAAADLFSGTVLIVQDGKPIYKRVAGHMCRRYDTPNQMDTKFNIGSMNKMVTAVAIAQLEEQGKLSYDDIVGKHLPEYANEAVRDKVQIRHLLTHTAGTGSHFTGELMAQNLSQFRSVSDFIDSFVDAELQFEPGTDASYSNAGFYILGAIIEGVTGQSYFDYVREHIYAPAGMTNTEAYDMDVPVKNLAIGYTRQPFGAMPDDAPWLEEYAGIRNNFFIHPVKGGPAGGGYSTTPDLIAFADALQSGRLISTESFQTLTTVKSDLPNDGYGYGFNVHIDTALGRVVGHSGGFPGINGNLSMLPDEGISIAVLANIDGGAERISRRFITLLAATK